MVEILGIIASIIIIIGFTTEKASHIRIWNCVGCILYIIYGVLIHSFSVCLLNTVCVAINISKLKK